jgi:hypothetical protein
MLPPRRYTKNKYLLNCMNLSHQRKTLFRLSVLQRNPISCLSSPAKHCLPESTLVIPCLPTGNPSFTVMHAVMQNPDSLSEFRQP